jgi:hypothetical protein
MTLEMGFIDSSLQSSENDLVKNSGKKKEERIKDDHAGTEKGQGGRERERRRESERERERE